jgi:uncharacterized protein DUF4325
MKTSFSSDELVDLAKGTESSSLLTRDQGRRLRVDVIEKLTRCERITLDLSQAQALSPSFADELFAGLEKELGSAFSKRVRIAGARPEWQRLISSALQHRRSQSAPPTSKTN